MPRIFYISSRVATQSPVLKTCHSKLNNLVAGNDAMKPLATGIYCNIIFRTPVHISAITIFLHFPKTFQFSICVAGERKEDDLILSPVTCGIVVNWKKDIKYPFEGQDTITLWRWKLLYYLCLKTVYNGWQQLKCIPLLIKGQCNVCVTLLYHFCRFLLQSSCDWCNILLWDLQCRYTNNVVQILWSCGYFL